MSCYVCSDKHILIVASIIATVVDRPLEALQIAVELRRENIRSVNYRYGERSRSPKGWETTVDYIHLEAFQNADKLALIECLDYQSCERPDYAKSHAGKMLLKAGEYFKSIVKPFEKSSLWSI